MKKYLIVTVRAHPRRDLAEILLLTRPEAENHHHEVIAAMAPPSQLTRGR
jgi:hypothetical protein